MIEADPLSKSGGRDRLSKITKKGDRYIRKLPIVGMGVPAARVLTLPTAAKIHDAEVMTRKYVSQEQRHSGNVSGSLLWSKSRLGPCVGNSPGPWT